MQPAQHSEPYARGYRYGTANTNMGANPYPVPGGDAADWEDGYWDAQADVASMREYVRWHDPEVTEADAGCIECTLGTVPRRLETGLCKYHQAVATLAKIDRK